MNILNDIGRSSKKLASLYRNLSCKLAAHESHLQFLTDCVDHHLTPFGLRLGLQPNSEREKEWLEKAQKERLRVTRLDFHDSVFRTKARLRGIIAGLERRGLRWDQVDLVKELGRKRYVAEKGTQERKKRKKFYKLLFERGSITYSNKSRRLPMPTEATVINLSSSPLTDAQRQVLTLGQNFAPPPGQFPSLEIAAKAQWSAELAKHHSTKFGNSGEDIAEFLNSAEQILTSANNHQTPKLPQDLEQALTSMRKDEKRVFVRADKAKSLIAIDKVDYTAAVLRTLQPPVYEEVSFDPAEKFAKDFNTTHLLTAFAGPAVKGGGNRMRGLGEAEKKLYQDLSQSHGRCGSIYALIKTHKYAHPPRTEEERLDWIRTLKVRPINPGYRSVDYNLSLHLTACLQTINRPPHSITGPDSVFDLLRRWNHMTKNFILVSLDIVAMFPSIDVDKAIPLIRDKLSSDAENLWEVSPLSPDALADLLRICINNTHAVVMDGDKERFFVQKRGLAMGKSFSPAVADIVVGEWERGFKDLAILDGGHLWDFVRYADDYLLLWGGSKEQLDSFVRRINELDKDIQVEVEVESNGRIPFLDILIQRNAEGFSTSVYRKPSNSGQVTPFASFSHPQHLKAGIASDARRAWKYSSSLCLRQREVMQIETTYKEYGFPANTISSEIKKVFRSLELKKKALPEPPPLDPPPAPIRVSLPFTGNSFHQLKRAASKIGIQVVAKPFHTIGSLISSKAKHRLPDMQQSGVVYAINCSCSTAGQSSVYIGETDRELETRVKEHIDGWRKGSKTSAFAAHKDCDPEFNQTTILARQPHKRLRLLYESAFIRVAGNRETIIVSPNDASINRNSGTMFDQRFLPIVQKCCKLRPRNGNSLAH